MGTLPQVCAAIIRTVTTETELAGRESGLAQRKRKLSGDNRSRIYFILSYHAPVERHLRKKMASSPLVGED